MARPRQSFVHRAMRQELLRFGAANRSLLIKSTVAAAAVIVVPLVMGSPAYVTGFVHAFVVTALLAIFGLAFLFAGDGALLLAGMYGEEYTRDELRTACKRGYVWGAVHNIEVGPQDIDHLVLTPSGVLALETKWRIRRTDDRWLESSVRQARASARMAHMVVLSRDVRERREVRPVLVVWGGGRREFNGIRVVDGVAVVPGSSLLDWLSSCGKGRMTGHEAALLQQRLTRFADARVVASSSSCAVSGDVPVVRRGPRCRLRKLQPARARRATRVPQRHDT